MELMVVVVIIGILTAIAVPVYNTLQTNAADNAHEANIRTIHGAVQNYVAANGLPNFDSAQWQTALVPDFLQAWPTHPGGVEGEYKVVDNFSYRVIFE